MVGAVACRGHAPPPTQEPRSGSRHRSRAIHGHRRYRHQSGRGHHHQHNRGRAAARLWASGARGRAHLAAHTPWPDRAHPGAGASARRPAAEVGTYPLRRAAADASHRHRAGVGVPHLGHLARHARQRRRTAAAAACRVNPGGGVDPPGLGRVAARARRESQGHLPHQGCTPAVGGNLQKRNHLASSIAPHNSGIAPCQAASPRRTAYTAYFPSSAGTAQSSRRATRASSADHNLHNYTLSMRRSPIIADESTRRDGQLFRQSLPCATRHRHIPLRHMRHAPHTRAMRPSRA